MTPQELISEFASLGVKVAERNLRNWVTAGLLPEPEHQNLGRGRGKRAIYSPDAAFFGYAAWRLKIDGNLKLPIIARVKQDVCDWWEAERIGGQLPESYKFNHNHFAWIIFFRLATVGVPTSVPVFVTDLERPQIENRYPQTAERFAGDYIEARILPSKGLEAKSIDLIKADGSTNGIYPN